MLDLIEKSIDQKGHVFVSIFILTLFLKHIYAPYALGLIVIYSIFSSVNKNSFKLDKDLWVFSIIPLVFIFNILIFGANIDTYQKFIRILPIILMPFAISLIKLTSRQIHFVLSFYIYSLIIFSIFWIGSVSTYYWQIETREHLLNLNRTILYGQVYIPRFFDFHTPYICLYILVGCLICWYKLKITNRIYYLGIFIFFILLMLYFTGRTALFIGLLLLVYTLLDFLISSRYNLIIVLGMVIVLFTIVVLSVNMFPMLHDKLLNISEKGFGVFHRIDYWKASINLIKEHPIFGYGFKNYQSELLAYFGKKDVTNIHNQYLEYLVPSGLIGLLCYLYFKGKLIIKSINTKNWIFLIFIIMFSLTEITESILSRQRGVMLFSLFSSLFYFSNYRETPPPDVSSIKNRTV
ncbi:O-antigen ligase family protein [Maribacter luteus]|uniref:O-antigen ligase-related domain-containing protein n=1 Tax=Maribacter luteus TaxID=2594478 RepID=A0A6I2MKK3_9FLAO|nr:O-antigen ligase family protein [Maribacter luteus]MRX64303.1 hypothetical protein [Maribacter luteus]